MDKTKYKIGEFSKLARVTVRTLRHYEDIGLLKPEIVDLYDEDSHYPSASAIESKIECCEKVTKMGQDSDLIKFKQLPEVPVKKI